MDQVLAASAAVARGSPTHAHPQRLSYLDGWRGLSIAAVLFGHFVGDLGFTFGQLGVEMFFVLSGRLMAQILFVDGFPLAEFYRRRISRIFPALVVLVLAVCVILHGRPYLGAKWSAGASVLTMTYNVLTVFGHRSPVFDHTWSLCVEEHSYILLAILAALARARGAPVKPVLLVGALLSMLDGAIGSAVFRLDYIHNYWRTDAHISSILVSAWLFLTIRERSRLPSWLSPLSAALGVASFASAVPEALHYTLGTTCLAIAVASLDRSWAPFRKTLSAPALTVTGVLSYSIYLWQQPFYQIAVWQMHLKAPATLGWGTVAVICGVVSYLAVERPGRRWLNSLPLPAFARQPTVKNA